MTQHRRLRHRQWLRLCKVPLQDPAEIEWSVLYPYLPVKEVFWPWKECIYPCQLFPADFFKPAFSINPEKCLFFGKFSTDCFDKNKHLYFLKTAYSGKQLFKIKACRENSEKCFQVLSARMAKRYSPGFRHLSNSERTFFLSMILRIPNAMVIPSNSEFAKGRHRAFPHIREVCL